MINRNADDKPVKKSGFAISLKGRALRLLAAREQSRTELEKKLKAHEETPGQLAVVLDELQAKEFISEARVVESVINRRQAKLGASRIRQELFSKGINKEAVSEAMAGLKATELDRAKELWRKKFGVRSDGQPFDRAAQAKQMRFLAARGFSGDVIRRVMAPSDDE